MGEDLIFNLGQGSLNYLRSNGVTFFFYLRDWDKYSFPHANKGFFSFKKKIPDLLIKNGFNNIF